MGGEHKEADIFIIVWHPVHFFSTWRLPSVWIMRQSASLLYFSTSSFCLLSPRLAPIITFTMNKVVCENRKNLRPKLLNLIWQNAMDAEQVPKFQWPALTFMFDIHFLICFALSVLRWSYQFLILHYLRRHPVPITLFKQRISLPFVAMEYYISNLENHLYVMTIQLH